MLEDDLQQVADDIRTQTEAAYHKLQKHALIQPMLNTLEKELPMRLSYHSIEHTKEVLFEVLLYSILDGRNERERELLAIAAAYHDAGFLERDHDNEILGKELACKAMRELGGYSEEEITLVGDMILDTRMIETGKGPCQKANTELSPYLLDADTSNLGRSDFFRKSDLLRQEMGYSHDISLQKTIELMNSHEWLSPAAQSLRTARKEQNLEMTRMRLDDLKHTENHVTYMGVSLERLGFLTRLPLFLNSSWGTKRVVSQALEQLNQRIAAEAATVFICDEKGDELTFWATQGGDTDYLEGKKMPGGQGIVGWVISKKQSVQVDDVETDERFFRDIDKETTFITRNMLCVPLIVRGDEVIGAIQILNSKMPRGFDNEDLVFLEHVAYQVAMALDNARLYDSLCKKNKMLAEIDKRKNQMINLVIHEFRTPLSVIQSGAELLLYDDGTNPERLEKLGKGLNKGVERLVRLINGIRNVSFVTQEDFTPDCEPCYVSTLVEDVHDQFAAALEYRNIDMTIENQENGQQVMADASLITVVLYNLLSNAVKFTEDEGSIMISIVPSAGMMQIQVKDTGIGIAEEHLDSIFDAFYEVADIMNHSSGGDTDFKAGSLGLGLATARTIVEAHGSQLEVRSTVGEGTTFSFRLRLADSTNS